MPYIESVEPGCIVITNDARFMEGKRAVLDRRALGQMLSVLEGAKASAKCGDDCSIRHNIPESVDAYDYTITIDGCEDGFSASEARVLKYALRSACLTVARTRT